MFLIDFRPLPPMLSSKGFAAAMALKNFSNAVNLSDNDIPSKFDIVLSLDIQNRLLGIMWTHASAALQVRMGIPNARTILTRIFTSTDCRFWAVIFFRSFRTGFSGRCGSVNLRRVGRTILTTDNQIVMSNYNTGLLLISLERCDKWPGLFVYRVWMKNLKFWRIYICRIIPSLTNSKTFCSKAHNRSQLPLLCQNCTTEKAYLLRILQISLVNSALSTTEVYHVFTCQLK